MTDVHNTSVRSLNMRAIRSKDTKPELYVRRLLHRNGFRFRLHPPNLPSKPDIYLPKYSAVIWVHGCFWHGHDCHLSSLPKSNVQFWNTKIEGNRKRDRRQLGELNALGIKVMIIWECALKGKKRLSEQELLERIEEWLLSIDLNCEITMHGLTSITFDTIV